MNKYKELRKKANLTQVSVAKQLKIDKSSVSKWEKGESSPRVDKLTSIAKLYNCSVEDLLVK